MEESDNSWWGSVKVSYKLTPPTPTPVGLAVIAKLQPQIATASGTYGIYVYRLSDRAGYGISSEMVLPAASIMKVPMMVATFRKVESGEVDLEEVEELLEAMGKRSDNQAPVTLIEMIGRPYMRQTVTDLGMTDSDFDANTTTAYDLGVMWRSIFEGRLINSTHRDQMYGFLTDSIFEERIPQGVPDDVRVVHKVGTDLDIWADSGIVFTSSPFIISILNDEVNQLQAKEIVPSLVQTIYQGETSSQ